jgi:hypothetical protein
MVSAWRQDYLSGSGVSTDMLDFGVDLACDRGAVRMSFAWKGQACRAFFRIDEARVAEIERLVSRVQLCTERRERNTTSPVLVESVVQFTRGCPADGPSSIPGSGGTNVNVHRIREWPYTDSHEARVFAAGHVELLAKLAALAEEHVTPQCPPNWREAFFAP